jgi:hypothetical protein
MDTNMDGNILGASYEDGSFYATAPRSLVVFVRHQDKDETPSTGLLA